MAWNTPRACPRQKLCTVTGLCTTGPVSRVPRNLPSRRRRRRRRLGILMIHGRIASSSLPRSGRARSPIVKYGRRRSRRRTNINAKRNQDIRQVVCHPQQHRHHFLSSSSRSSSSNNNHDDRVVEERTRRGVIIVIRAVGAVVRIIVRLRISLRPLRTKTRRTTSIVVVS